MASYLEALILGVLYGLWPCSIFCAPILIPLIITTVRTGKEGIIQVFNFGFGRILAYLSLGGLAGGTGYLLNNLIPQKLIGVFVVLLGVFILIGYFLAQKKHSSCSIFLTKGKELSFITGLVIGLGPCPPLLALLSLAVLEKSFLTGMTMGLFFGTGSLVTPLIIFGFLAGKLSSLKEFQTVVPFVSSLFLIIFGLIKIF